MKDDYESNLDEELARTLGEKIAMKVISAAGESLLRHALTMLTQNDDDWPRRIAAVYQALMAATNAGYKCGIVAGSSVTYETDITAQICLPHGIVTIDMPQMGEHFSPILTRNTASVIEKFLTAQGESDDT